jgi:hypothetical protein
MMMMDIKNYYLGTPLKEKNADITLPPGDHPEVQPQRTGRQRLGLH